MTYINQPLQYPGRFNNVKVTMYYEVDLHRRLDGWYAVVRVPISTGWLNINDLMADLREGCDGLCEVGAIHCRRARRISAAKFWKSWNESYVMMCLGKACITLESNTFLPHRYA